MGEEWGNTILNMGLFYIDLNVEFSIIKSMAIALSTIKRLFARSRNQCAFPSCCCKIVELDGVITGQICHICAQKKGGPRYNKNLPLKERDGLDNLIILCSKHHKIIDSDPEKYSREILLKYKKEHETHGPVEITSSDSMLAKQLYAHYVKISKTNIISIGNVENVIIKTNNKVSMNYPEGCIGANVMASNYVHHLAKRYNEFSSKQPIKRGGKTFSFSVIWTTLNSKFKVPSYKRIPINKLDDIIAFLQKKIDNTMQGKINKSKGIKNYSSFEEYSKK